MRKLIAITLVLIIIGVASISLAQESLKPRIKTLVVLGRGIVTSSDPANFKMLKVGIAKVIVSLGGNETELAAGILHLDSDGYRLRNIQTTNDTASADIYLNDTMIGTLSISSTLKGDHLIWFGTIKINDQNWNAYILESERKAKPEEAAEKIEDLCESSPERCKDIARGIGNRFCEKVEDRSCREKIREYCNENPTDERCKSVFRLFCKDNLEDERCRKELKEFCVDNSTDERCVRFCIKYPKVCRSATTTTTTETEEEETTTTTTQTTTTTTETTTTTTNTTNTQTTTTTGSENRTGNNTGQG
ncbi:MAG: hypothetical protein J4452_00655 [Candidatus Aenigmarchaeota archaeon]|nr:hypothetical protein [Candidatus Aenigmarchaeota archaeon]